MGIRSEAERIINNIKTYSLIVRGDTYPHRLLGFWPVIYTRLMIHGLRTSWGDVWSQVVPVESNKITSRRTIHNAAAKEHPDRREDHPEIDMCGLGCARVR